MASNIAFTKTIRPDKISYKHVSPNCQTGFAKEINIICEVDHRVICPIFKFRLNAIERYEQ